METRQIVLAARPKGMPDNTVFRFENVELPPLQEGEVKLRGDYYSVDPYMRGRMSTAKSYMPPFDLDKPLEGGVVGTVTESRHPGFAPGDTVAGSLLPWSTSIIVPASAIYKVDPQLAPPSYYVGILGMPGLTAYCGLLYIGRPKPGETVVVSGAAGAVGLITGQVAKILGCRVVGIAGTAGKVKLLTEEYGFDAALNYREEKDLSAAIAQACPKGVDIYFDNVGGEISDAVMPHLNFYARIPLCGQIDNYNDTEPRQGPRWGPLMLTRSVLLQGFLVRQFKDQHPAAMQQLTQWVKEKKLHFTETVEEGFDRLPEALLGLFSGRNTGKMVVKA